ncbi:teichoic acid translocation permease TagG [Listeria fleischmannii subsp. fleischmannii LU2006-1]|nr:teichoic acid translocation permease TagG [Listeria fleischmannii subsp. fleischmannii LU2006-1]
MAILTILREQIQNFGIIYRVAHYENKASYQGHYLGYFWQFLNPLIQIAIYYLVFSVGFKSASLEFILIGIIPWFFISNVILQGANSIFNQIHMASKMRFPLSTLPSITIVSNLSSFFCDVFCASNASRDKKWGFRVLARNDLLFCCDGFISLRVFDF